jgi:hypothetical protein
MCRPACEQRASEKKGSDYPLHYDAAPVLAEKLPCCDRPKRTPIFEQFDRSLSVFVTRTIIVPVRFITAKFLVRAL